MPKFNPEGRSSAPDVDLRDAYQAVDPFDAESVQRRQDWLDYINTRPRMDGAGNVHEPGTGRFMSVDMKDDGNQRHYNDIYNATLHEGSRENMGVLSLARLANEAYLRGDKTMLSDLESEIVDKLADLQKEYNLSQESVDARMDKLQSIVYAGTPVGEKKSAINTDPEAEGVSGTGNSGLDLDVVKRQPISAREVAKRLNAEGKEFSLEELDKALDDQENGGEEDNFSDREKLLLSEVEELRKENEELKTQLEEIKNLLDQQADKSLKAKLANIFRRKSPEKGDKLSWRNRLKKIGAGTLAAASLIGVAWGVNGLNDDVEAAPQQATATTEEVGSAQSLNPLDFDLAESGESETETVRGYDRELDPFFAENKTSEYNMSNGFPTDVDPSEAMKLWQNDWENSPEMMAMIAAELGMDGAEDPTSLDDLLTHSVNDYENWADRIEAMLAEATDIHYEVIPAGTVYNSWYTTLDENGDPQIVYSYGVSHDHPVTILVFTDKNGERHMVNSECGQIVNYEIVSYDNVPNFKPPAPNTDNPSVPVTPPTPPETPETPYTPPAPETDKPNVELEKKDPTVGIGANKETPDGVELGDQAGDMTSDPSQGGDTAPAEQPSETYTPPVQETESQVADEAEQSQVEQRQKQANQGVETGDGKTTASGEVAPNNGTVDPNASNQ